VLFQTHALVVDAVVRLSCISSAHSSDAAVVDCYALCTIGRTAAALLPKAAAAAAATAAAVWTDV
jgi:hypothetical protein